MLDILLLVCFIVILKEDCMRKIGRERRVLAAILDVLVESLKGVDLQRGKKRRRVDQLG
jgi:hypothetical protein